jgi:hypothetical protein
MNAVAHKGPQQPLAMIFGGLTLVLPTADRRLTDRQWADLSCAVVLDFEGSPDIARDLLAQVEAKLGTNEAHRRAAASSPETVTGAIREAKRRAKLEANRHASTLDLPIRDPDIVKAIAACERQAHEKRAEAASLRIIGAKAHRRAIKALEAAARGLDQKAQELLKTEEDDDRLYGDAKDPILRARARGEEITAGVVELAEVARDEYGARIIHRDGPSRGLPVLKYDKQTRARKLTGIEHAFHAGYLEGGHGSNSQDALREVGLIYAESYEVAVGGTSSSGEGGTGYGAKGPQLRVIEAGDRLKIMRAGLTKRQRDVLDLVCGQDMRVREAATALKAGFPATERALRGGLETCRASWAAAMVVGRVGAESWRVMMLDAVIGKVRP